MCHANPLLAAALVATAAAETFTSGGHSIGVDVFHAPGEGKHAAVVFLHGADGLRVHAASYRQSCETLARHGYEVFLVHYFDRTGTTWAGGSEISRNFLEWMETAGDAITYAQSSARVDARRVGFVGISLGASLALSVASQDPRVIAVAEFYGAMPDLAAAFMSRMPPVLILHGAADHLVPVAEAYKLERLLKQKGIPYEAEIYPHQGHGLSGTAAKDAERRTLEFLARHLG